MNFECENCGHAPTTKACMACGKQLPLGAKFCLYCGVAQKQETTSGGDPFDMNNRRLCPDGACIGILGADGHCIVCGKSE